MLSYGMLGGLRDARSVHYDPLSREGVGVERDSRGCRARVGNGMGNIKVSCDSSQARYTQGWFL